MSDPHSVRGLRLCALFALVSLCATASAADDPGARAPLVVWTVKGDVHATSGARDIPLKAGLALQLPVSIRVGADGALEMHQGATVVSAAANSQLQIPKATSSDQTLDRIVQSEGNVYYNVAKRPAHKLRVETPLLVAVIKGTRFNVSAADAMTTISLLEGSIEVHASDDASVVDLSAGQMATRSRSQPAIRVIRMTTGEVIHGPTAEVVAALGAGQRVDSALQGQGRSRDEVNRPAPLVAISPVATEVPTSALATGVASGQGDDHGASSSLTLNQLVTHADSSANASNVGGSTSAGPGVDTGTSGSNGGSLGANTGTSGSNGGSLSAGTGTSGTGASGSGGGSLGSGTGTSGSGGGSLGSGASTSGTGGGSSGSGASTSGTGAGSLGANTGTSSTSGGGVAGTTGNPASGASGTGSASNSGSGNGNGNGSGNAGTTFSPGNSGITVTPGSGPGTSSASNSGNSGGGSSNGQGPGSSNGQGASNSNGSNGQGASNSNGSNGSGSSSNSSSSSNGSGSSSNSSGGSNGSGSSNSSGSSNGSGNSSNSNGQGPGNLNAALQSLLNKKKK